MEDNFDYDYKEEISKIFIKRKKILCNYDSKKHIAITDIPEKAIEYIDEYEQKLRDVVNEKYKKEEQKQRYIEAINDVLNEIDKDKKKYKIEKKWIPLDDYYWELKIKIIKVLRLHDSCLVIYDI